MGMYVIYIPVFKTKSMKDLEKGDVVLLRTEQDKEEYNPFVIGSINKNDETAEIYWFDENLLLIKSKVVPLCIIEKPEE